MKKDLVILIVDDNIRFADRMTEMLEDLSNIDSIKVASGYDDGFKLFIEQKPKLVLLDINLPGKNGIELLKAIRKSDWACEVIIITNHSNEYYRQQCRELGVQHFLDKSNEFALVPEIVSQRVFYE